MNKCSNLRWVVLAGVLVMLAGLLSAQRPRILVVNGRNAGPVLQMRGRNYVDVETLAQNTNASVNFQPDHIILTIPGSGAATAQSPEGLSKEFANAAFADLAQMREWKGAIETMITFRVPVTGTYLQDYHDRAEEGLRLANVAASNPSDHNAYQLLQNGFTTLAHWAGNAVAARQALNATRTLGPDVLQNDPVLEKISSCSKFLSTMLVSGSFADDPSCH
jgi:hypothetical protein